MQWHPRPLSVGAAELHALHTRTYIPAASPAYIILLCNIMHSTKAKSLKIAQKKHIT